METLEMMALGKLCMLFLGGFCVVKKTYPPFSYFEIRSWNKFPEIKALLEPKVANDGIFWMTKKEFFNFFTVISLCAKSMTGLKR
jgi:hypothetical protein